MNSNPLLKTAVNFGAMSGLCSFAVFLGLYYKGINPLGNASWLGWWIPVVFICIATKIYRDRFLAGEISYGQAMKIGLTTAMAASFLFVLLIYIFASLIDSNVVTMYKNEALKGMEETKFIFSDEMYEEAIESIEKINIRNIAFNDFLTKMFGALLVSLVTAAVYRRKKQEMEN
jgi:uncharacterized protein DUF4199